MSAPAIGANVERRCARCGAITLHVYDVTGWRCLVCGNGQLTAGDTGSTVVFVLAHEFVADPVPQAEPIVVDATGATVVAADGFVLVYGGGGAGKTTLWLDGGLHFACGDKWLDGLLVPTRELRVGWIENEGPQEEFRRKLERKLGGWHDRLPDGHLHVLAKPWGGLDLRRDDHRAGLAAEVRDRDLDLLFLGPLNDLGMEGGGTPDEVRYFHGYLRDVQSQAERRVALCVVHHENNAGRVSGAWTGRPDVLVHVTAQGHGNTRVHWQKARWSSSLHGTTNHLRWSDGESFTLAPDEAPRPERTWDDIAAYVLAHGGCRWSAVKDAVHGDDNYLTRRRDQMLDGGVLVNAGTDKRFLLWHRDDPARPPDLNRVDATHSPHTPHVPSEVEGEDEVCGGVVPVRAPHTSSPPPPTADTGLDADGVDHTSPTATSDENTDGTSPGEGT